uniref:Uncharacterized protein n=2 Tax=unclassified Caudoviricetes TaxID=2788787 RepID=A0A8S5UZU3_9CAUD|nr:MAG TPA: hypothetical protein [Myoviridae sp. ctZSu31]DAF99972.1 MAG TPA: hypothetical protein [Myoviridae sp. ctGk74]
MRRGLLHISEPKRLIYPTLPLSAGRQGTQNTHGRALPEGKSPLLIIASLPSHIFCFLFSSTAPSGSGFYDYHLIRQPASDTFPSRGRQGCRQDFVLNQHNNCVLTPPQSALLTAPPSRERLYTLNNKTRVRAFLIGPFIA